LLGATSTCDATGIRFPHNNGVFMAFASLGLQKNLAVAVGEKQVSL
jgi:hypothetical protein